MTSGSHTVNCRLAPHPASVGEGRRFIRGVLTRGDHAHLVEAAELLVSEVVTNALVHAGTEVEVVARVGDTGIRVEVSDGSTRLPRTKSYLSLTATGRGLQLLEQLVDRWGVDPHAEGKTVWFELRTQQDASPQAHPMQQSLATDLAQDAGRVTVELLDVPLLLHAAWQMQAESLLREYLLSQLDEDNGTDQIGRHAAAADALDLLRDQLPGPDLENDPGDLMLTSEASQVSADRVVVSVPTASVPHFALLREMLATATHLADTGELLTPPTQPEMQALRQWLCHQVQTQTLGGRPAPWTGDQDGATPTRATAPWDPSVVAAATTAMLAADDTDRILAVSPAALTLLGYDDPSELVLHRLIDIIPVRFRQAHLAGFTLHLFAGRSPLLDTLVEVPAVRRDGTEVTVGLTIHAIHLPGARRVFVADLSEPATLGRSAG